MADDQSHEHIKFGSILVCINKPSTEINTQPTTPRPKWSELFSKSKTTTSINTSSVIFSESTRSPIQNNRNDPFANTSSLLNDIVSSKFKLSDPLPHFRTRGMSNPGNACFINCILQPLFHCPPFFNLFKCIAQIDFPPSNPPSLLSALSNLALELSVPDDENPLTPDVVQDAMIAQGNFNMVRGRQEDAQEFLGYLLDGLHQEWVKATSTEPSTDKTHLVIDDEWLQVGKHNKQNKTRHVESTSDSPFTKIFTGKMLTVVKYQSGTQSTILEPFQTLPLFIDTPSIQTLNDALIHFSESELIDEEKSTYKATYLMETTNILVIQFKRFIYNAHTQSIQKSFKKIKYPDVLNIDPKVWASSQPNTQKKKGKSQSNTRYKLFGVVNHHGKLVEGGHYTCDVLSSNENVWYRMDDETVEDIPESDVLDSLENAYLLFYQRS